MSATAEIQPWTLTVGDPTVGGWLTTVLYMLAALSALVVYRHVAEGFQQQVKRQRVLWLLIALTLFFLGFNKQLDLHVWLLDQARVLADWQGWYDEQRRMIQIGFIKTSAAVSVLLVGVFAILYRNVIGRHILAIVGVCLLAAYAIIRVTVFQTPDVLWWHFRFGLQINWLLESIGLVLILINAAYLLRPVWQSIYSVNPVESEISNT